MNKKSLLQTLFFFRTAAADLLYLVSGKAEMIDKDVERYLEETPYREPGIRAFNYCLLFIKPFRNIFYYRTRNNHALGAVCRLFLPPVSSIEIIGGEIGEGLRIDHNFCVIRPGAAGRNLSVRNGVTIGKGRSSGGGGATHPVMGDNVDIYANAVIFGGIHIGSNVKIGAGAVVNRDVPDNCTVVGNPMRIIRHEEEKGTV